MSRSSNEYQEVQQSDDHAEELFNDDSFYQKWSEDIERMNIEHQDKATTELEWD
jgi:hypothetical protein